jgi:hypothetical protein
MDFLTKLPRPFAEEALVLLRRLEFLKSSISNDSHSGHESLSDVGDFQDFMYHYFRAHNTTVCEFVVNYERYALDKLLEGEHNED